MDEDNLSIEYDILDQLAGTKKAFVFELDPKNNDFWFQIKTPVY